MPEEQTTAQANVNTQREGDVVSATDVAVLEGALLRVSAMVEDIPQIAELDCNPFVVGATILDARIRVATVAPPPLIGVRR